jgi:hypothetical protein
MPKLKIGVPMLSETVRADAREGLCSTANRRAAEQRDEFAATEVDCHVPLPWEAACPCNGGTISLFERAVRDSRSGAPPVLTGNAKTQRLIRLCRAAPGRQGW